MNILKIESTNHTPEICFNPETSEYRIEGKSMPENAVEHYTPVLAWVNALAESELDNCNFEIRVSYLNTASSKVLFNVLKAIKIAKDNGKSVKITWYYDQDDDDLEDTGILFREQLGDVVELKPEDND